MLDPKLHQLITLKHAVRLEAKGIKRRGRSATAIAKEQLRLIRQTSRDEVLRQIQITIDKTAEELGYDIQ